MKKLTFLTFLLLAFSCKKKDKPLAPVIEPVEPAPPAKVALIHTSKWASDGAFNADFDTVLLNTAAFPLELNLKVEGIHEGDSAWLVLDKLNDVTHEYVPFTELEKTKKDTLISRKWKPTQEGRYRLKTLYSELGKVQVAKTVYLKAMRPKRMGLENVKLEAIWMGMYKQRSAWQQSFVFVDFDTPFKKFGIYPDGSAGNWGMPTGDVLVGGKYVSQPLGLPTGDLVDWQPYTEDAGVLNKTETIKQANAFVRSWQHVMPTAQWNFFFGQDITWQDEKYYIDQAKIFKHSARFNSDYYPLERQTALQILCFYPDFRRDNTTWQEEGRACIMWSIWLDRQVLSKWDDFLVGVDTPNFEPLKFKWWWLEDVKDNLIIAPYQQEILKNTKLNTPLRWEGWKKALGDDVVEYMINTEPNLFVNEKP